MTYDDLLALCRERKIKGLFNITSTGKVNLSKETMIESLKENVVRITAFDYIIKHNPSILTKFVGNQDELKKVSFGTTFYYTWKCDTPDCSNTFEAKPSIVFTNNLPRKYCDTCSYQNRKINSQIACLKRSGTILEKFPFKKFQVNPFVE